MSEHDAETFARFARRFKAIDAEIGDPPQPSWRSGGTPSRSRSRGLLPALAVIAIGVALAVLSPIFASRDGRSSTGSAPAVGGVAPTSTAPPSSSAPTESSLVPLDPATPPEELPGPCLGHTTVYDRLRTTVEHDAAVSSTIVIGTITAIGGAQWNTTDGRAPQDPYIEASRVLRLLRVNVDNVVKGTAPAVVTAWIPGGVIGCHRFNTGGFADAQIGRRYVFFLNESPPRRAIDGAITAWQTWSIEGSNVLTSYDGNLPLDMFITRASDSR